MADDDDDFDKDPFRDERRSRPDAGKGQTDEEFLKRARERILERERREPPDRDEE